MEWNKLKKIMDKPLDLDLDSSSAKIEEYQKVVNQLLIQTEQTGKNLEKVIGKLNTIIGRLNAISELLVDKEILDEEELHEYVKRFQEQIQQDVRDQLANEEVIEEYWDIVDEYLRFNKQIPES